MQRLEKAKLIQRKYEEQEKSLKKIDRLKAMLEQSGKMNETQQCMEYLQGVEKTGRATESKYEEMCDIEGRLDERILCIIESAPK